MKVQQILCQTTALSEKPLPYQVFQNPLSKRLPTPPLLFVDNLTVTTRASSLHVITHENDDAMPGNRCLLICQQTLTIVLNRFTTKLTENVFFPDRTRKNPTKNG